MTTPSIAQKSGTFVIGGDLTVNRLRRGVFHSVPELVAALEQYIAQHNKEPKPFIWTAKAKDILAKVARARKKLALKTTLR